MIGLLLVIPALAQRSLNRRRSTPRHLPVQKTFKPIETASFLSIRCIAHVTDVVFFFQLPQPPPFAHVEVGLLLFPGVEGLLGNPKLLAEVAGGGAALGLADCVHDLFFRQL